MQDACANDDGRTLVVIPALQATPGRGGAFGLTRKFVDGIQEYVARWPGPVSVLVDRAEHESSNLDPIDIDPARSSFDIQWMPAVEADLNESIRSAELVLASLVDRNVDLAQRCRQLDVPLVYITEYSLKTRCQIVRAETRNPILRWRRELWNRRIEREYLRAIALATGVQCNGTPTFESYRNVNGRPLLYFDTRVRAEHVATMNVINDRTKRMLSGGPLRLAFSGRLTPMKGVDHLPIVAAELKRLGIEFTLDICGGGSLENQLQRDIDRLGLNEHIRLRGVLDFETELMPLISRDIDLFVCCHRQGDPSCTYLETMSCGTPIVGYDNEAFLGVIKHSGVGWGTPMDQPEALAARIAQLDKDRQSMAHAAVKSREFAAMNTFESTMDKRVEHMKSCAAMRIAPAVGGIAG